jgi:hypothetical protein
MPNPVPAIIEAIGATMDGWKPQDGSELLAFLDGLPELLEKLQETLRSTLAGLAEEAWDLGDSLEGSADEIDRQLGDAHGTASDLVRDFREENAFWISDD